MMKMFISILLIFLSLFMLFLNNPISMGFIILIQTMLTCVLSGMLIKTYWFSYILFITFMGGLLVLFIYVSSIASNEMFNFSPPMKIYINLMLMLSIITPILFFDNLSWMNLTVNSEMNNFFNYYLMINNEYKMNITKLYNTQTFLLMTLLIIYLFITLIAIVKITNIFYGPLRSSM